MYVSVGTKIEKPQFLDLPIVPDGKHRHLMINVSLGSRHDDGHAMNCCRRKCLADMNYVFLPNLHPVGQCSSAGAKKDAHWSDQKVADRVIWDSNCCCEEPKYSHTKRQEKRPLLGVQIVVGARGCAVEEKLRINRELTVVAATALGSTVIVHDVGRKEWFL